MIDKSNLLLETSGKVMSIDEDKVRLRINYKVYVDQAAKDAGGREIINDWDESDAGADTDIVDGNILAVAEAIVAAKLSA